MSDLDSRIVELTRQAWNDQGAPLLLARLGACDNGDIARMAKERSVNLEGYLRGHLVNRVRIVRHSARHQLVGVLPADVDVDSYGGPDTLLDKISTIMEDAVPRYHPALWAAFKKPLDDSERRYVSAYEPIKFVDSSNADVPNDHYEIARKYIAGPDVDPDQIQNRVQQWLTDNGINRQIYSLKSKSDLLDRLLNSLDTEDLKRISMPLDVIRKLRRKRP